MSSARHRGDVPGSETVEAAGGDDGAEENPAEAGRKHEMEMLSLSSSLSKLPKCQGLLHIICRG